MFYNKAGKFTTYTIYTTQKSMFQHKIVRQERKRERHIGKSKPN